MIPEGSIPASGTWEEGINKYGYIHVHINTSLYKYIWTCAFNIK